MIIKACFLERFWTSLIHFFEGVEVSMLPIRLQRGEVFQRRAHSR